MKHHLENQDSKYTQISEKVLIWLSTNQSPTTANCSVEKLLSLFRHIKQIVVNTELKITAPD